LKTIWERRKSKRGKVRKKKSLKKRGGKKGSEIIGRRKGSEGNEEKGRNGEIDRYSKGEKGRRRNESGDPWVTGGAKANEKKEGEHRRLKARGERKKNGKKREKKMPRKRELDRETGKIKGE